MSLLPDIAQNLKNGNVEKVQEGIKEALENEVPPEKILNEALINAMEEIGAKFKKNEVYVPEVLIAARAMKGGMELLKPHLVSAGIEAAGRIVIGTVEGDLHDIGKNLVSMMFEGAGFDVIDIGIDVPSEDFVKAVKEHKPDILGMSALLTTTMPQMKEVIDAIEEEGIRDDISIMIGGAPVSEDFAEEIGADAFGADAATAAEIGKEIVG